DRNVLELTTMLPDPPEVDRYFYADVWQPQEIRHGIVLDRLQVELGRPPAVADVDTVSAKLEVLGALAHLGAFQDVVRMLYYLTGMATERSAVLAYNLLHDGVLELGEEAVARTVIAPIRRQEPGHYAFYQLSARGLWSELSTWQKWLVRQLRRRSFGPVGTNNAEQRADFGDVMLTLGIADDSDRFATQVARVEQELLWAHASGLPVPPYVLAAFRDALELALARTPDPSETHRQDR
ncbi:MAG: GTP-binding protein LepA, partial [Nocardioides sp.]|nr:GTP-binding protein LepA [Nocardioides sp.]